MVRRSLPNFLHVGDSSTKIVEVAAGPATLEDGEADETELHLAVVALHVLAAGDVLDGEAAAGTEADAGDGDGQILAVLARQHHLLAVFQKGLVFAEAALLVAAVIIVPSFPGVEAEETEVSKAAALVGALDLVAAALFLNRHPAARTALGETLQPVFVELGREEAVLLARERAQLAAEGVVPLAGAPLEGAEDLPPPLLCHALQQREDGLAAHQVAAGHADHAQLQRDLVLHLAQELDVGHLAQRDLVLRDDVFESEQRADALVVPDPLPAQLQHHLARRQRGAHAPEDQLFELNTGERGVDENVLRLPVGQPQQHQREAGRQRVALPPHRQHHRLVVLAPHASIIIMLREQRTPVFLVAPPQPSHRTLTVLLPTEAVSLLPPGTAAEFLEKGKATAGGDTFVSAKECRRYTIEHSCDVRFSRGVEELPFYSGLASGLLASAYTFSLKTGDQSPAITVSLSSTALDAPGIVSLANALVRSIILANGRGDDFGSPAYFVQKSKELAAQLGLGLKVVGGEELRAEGLNLFHAVGRGSRRAPALINLSYRGDESSEEWVAVVGKGICFDSGGLDLKGSEHLRPMFLDKSGACSCLSAIEHIAREKLRINVTATLGMAENLIGQRSYRPSDIITSKKGLTVEIADTDAEGRLVLADCMTWTQLNYRVARMVELSTLTYSIIVGLGHGMAGIFGNCFNFSELLRAAGEQVLERAWIMPLEESHQEFLASKGADLLSDANDTSPGAAIAAAFLQNFVEEGVEWVHLDVAGTCISLEENRGTGFGARLLLQLARMLSHQRNGL